MTPSWLFVVGAVPEAPSWARRNGASGVVDRRKVTGWIGQGTWELLPLPSGKTAGKGKASVTNKDPGPPPGLHGGGSALSGGHEPRQAPAEPAGETNEPKAMRGQEVVAL